ncbi:glyoxalase/bleomycin resistance protein/dioxygenase [Galbibacter marinus]|uniref:Glyoxalase/bleomycin resistance protein/dioxygenase n=1 Tax=Galbibacter marinus TaxID=555500 RepID=K2QJ89_9FLAO|nr:glyoxalase/bleomycin resistance protein/dioxygenase [Galbibacter marinus]
MKVNMYLNFDGNAEEAFNFYKSVFGGEFSFMMRFSDAPEGDKIPKEEQNRLMHISLPLGGDSVLMASDIMPSSGHTLERGNMNYISLHTESREEADRLFNGLSKGGSVEMPMEDQFWGDYFGCFVDKFGIHWMVNHNDQF